MQANSWKWLALTAGVLLTAGALSRGLAGCGGSSTTVSGSPSDAGSAADGAPAPSAQFPVKHVVFLVKENRTFDNYFGKFPGANGATKGTLSDGGVIPLAPMPDSVSPDISHAWEAAITAYNDGGMDQFDLIPGAVAGTNNYVQATQQDIPNYWQLAQDFVLGDAFFSSLHGPSFPNHLYTIAAQSGGVEDNPGAAKPGAVPAPTVGPCTSPSNCPEPGEAGLEPSDIPSLPQNTGVWGCDAQNKEKVPVLDQEGEVVDIYPCLDFPTLGDVLTAAGITWKMYAPATGTYDGGFQGSGGYIWTVYDAIRHIRDSSEWAAHVVPTEQFAIDAQAGNLPQVSWISTPSPVSEHPPASTCEGENWTVSLITALGAGANWNDSAMFIVWDDFGGFYDHVAPTQIDDFGLGFRVPLLVVSPYAKQGYIDHTRLEFSSVLKFIETNWGLPPLTDRDKTSPDMTEAFDFTQTPRPPPQLQQRTSCPQF